MLIPHLESFIVAFSYVTTRLYRKLLHPTINRYVGLVVTFTILISFLSLKASMHIRQIINLVLYIKKNIYDHDYLETFFQANHFIRNLFAFSPLCCHHLWTRWAMWLSWWDVSKPPCLEPAPLTTSEQLRTPETVRLIIKTKHSLKKRSELNKEFDKWVI